MGDTVASWMRDLKHAARGLLTARGFTLVTVATLALAIGANTAIFSVVNAVLLDPLPFPDADRLVVIRGSAPGVNDGEEFRVSDELYVQYRDNATMLEVLGAYSGGGQSSFRAGGRVERLFGVQVNPAFFHALGATPVIGRLPTLDDAENVIVISHRLWMNWFGGDPSVIGSSHEYLENSFTVIGVMGPDFRFPDERRDIWINGIFEEAEMDMTGGGVGGLSLVGRMTPGTEHEGLATQLELLAHRLPDSFGASDEYRSLIEQHVPVVRSLEKELVGDIEGPLWMLMGTVVIVLLIACANVANLFIARAESRRRDLAVRRALGAGRIGLIRAQMAEALLLAALGGIGGAVLAWVGVPLLIRAAPESMPNLDAVGLNATALLFTAGVSILAACAFGLLPAIRSSNPGLVGGLRQTGRIGDAPGGLSRNALVVVQTAAALVLLVGAGLLVRSFVELTRIDPGYDTEDIFTFQIDSDIADGAASVQFNQSFMRRVAGLPAVESVGLTALLPLDEGGDEVQVVTELKDGSGEPPAVVELTVTGGDYFETMGIQLESGRLFVPNDYTSQLASAIVSRSATERLWPGLNPLGQRLRPAEAPIWMTVVGVVEDIFLADFRQGEPDPMLYVPQTATLAVASPAYVVKTSRAGSIAPDIRALVRELAPESPFYRIFTMEALADRSMAPLPFTMLLLGIAAVLALILGAVGLYGVLSYGVSQRTREIAVRMALGAEAPGLRRMIVLQGGRVTLLGIVLGLLAALAATRVLESLLFGVGTLDPITFVGLSAVMLGVAVLASYIPALRASSVDPMRSLRVE